MKIVYVGHNNTNCTRALAFLSEAGLISEKVIIKREVSGDWTLSLIFEDDLMEPDKVEEIDWHCQDYALMKRVS